MTSRAGRARRLPPADVAALAVGAGDGVAVLDDVTGVEQVDGGREEQLGDLAGLAAAEVALHVGQVEDVQAERVHGEGVLGVGVAVHAHVDHPVEVAGAERRGVADPLAARPVQGAWARPGHQHRHHLAQRVTRSDALRPSASSSVTSRLARQGATAASRRPSPRSG
jgi:hypothetical protein